MAQPLVVAHRGNSSAYVENTLEAFESALEMGCPAVECDVRLAACGTPVVFHDPTVSRLTGIDKKVSELTYRELQALEMKDGPAHIIDLGSLLDLVADYPQARIFVETKTVPGFSTDLEDNTALAIHRSRMNEDAISFISFDPLSLKRLSERVPRCDRLLLRRDWWPTSLPTPTRAAGRMPTRGVGMSLLALKTKQILWPKSGLRYLWTVNEQQDLAWALDQQIDYIATDYPARALAIQQVPPPRT